MPFFFRPKNIQTRRGKPLRDDDSKSYAKLVHRPHGATKADGAQFGKVRGYNGSRNSGNDPHKDSSDGLMIPALGTNHKVGREK